jgi:hypothetical protein
MAVKLNGTTGHLYIDASPITAYPYALFGWDSLDTEGSAFQCPVAYGRSTSEYWDCFTHYQYTNKYALTKHPGESHQALKTATPNASTTMRPFVAVFTSASNRTVYYGDNVAVTNTDSNTNNVASSTRLDIGRAPWTSAPVPQWLNGSVAEIALFNTSGWSGTTQIDLLLAGAKPEDVTGCVKCFPLTSITDLTSTDGLSTLTLEGGVTNSGQAHPITRGGATVNLVGSNLTGASSITTGAVSITAPAVNLVGSNLTAGSSVTSGAVTVTPAGATIVFDDPENPGEPLDFGKNTGAYYFESAPVTVYFNLASTNALIATASLTTNADATLDDYLNASFVASTAYRCVFKFADGSEGMVTLEAV